VHLSSHFRHYTTGEADVVSRGSNLAEIVGDLDRQFRGLRFRIIDEQDRIRPHINIFVGGEKVDSLAAPIEPSQEVFIMGALSGG
jgi:molybdopterin converting factor small subunit